MSGFAPGPVAGFAPRPKKLNGVLRRAVAAWKAEHYQPNIDSLVDLTGRGHHARFGSAIGADTNDPLHLPFNGQKYLHCPGEPSNYGITTNAVWPADGGEIILEVDITPGTASTGPSRGVGGGDNFLRCLYDAVNERVSFQWFKAGGAYGGGTPGEAHARGVRKRWRGVISSDRSTITQQEYVSGSWETRATRPVTDSLTGRPTALAIGYRDSFSGVGDQRFAGAIHRLTLTSGGTAVADFNPADSAEPHTSWVSSATGETWTITRSATGRKAVLVDRPLLLLGTDDFLEVADHADLNPGAGSFTAVTVARRHGVPTANQVQLSKYHSDALPGHWSEWRTDGTLRAYARDGTTNYSVSSADAALGVTRQHANVIDREAGRLRSYLNGLAVGTPADITGAPPITNTRTLRIGAHTNNTGFADFEFIGAAIFREALTPTDLALLAAEFGVTP